jgi:hypothetical protein
VVHRSPADIPFDEPNKHIAGYVESRGSPDRREGARPGTFAPREHKPETGLCSGWSRACHSAPHQDAASVAVPSPGTSAEASSIGGRGVAVSPALMGV